MQHKRRNNDEEANLHHAAAGTDPGSYPGGSLRPQHASASTGNNFSGSNDVCNFVESGALAIAWNGSVSPCLPLMHTHTHYIKGRWRISRAHLVGNVNRRDMLDIWHDPQDVAYRDHVQGFAFAPCTFCGGCEMLDGNEEDCAGNVFPACGGCLWAQGLIQCP